MKTIQETLQDKVDIITKALNLPVTASSRVNGKYFAHVGHLRIDHHVIGDSSHYHLHQTVNEGGAIKNFLLEDSFSAMQLCYTLNGYIACLNKITIKGA